jgi:hypothetical protein
MPRGPNVAVCTATFSKMWLAGTPTRVIAETLKISADRCDATRRQLGLPRRESWHGSKAGHRKAYIPSEAEIRQKCLEFQAGWSEEERARRRVGWSPDPKPVEIRVIPESIVRANYSHLAEENTPGGYLEELTDRGTSGD